MYIWVFGVDWITDILVWGANAKDKAPPIRVENAFATLGSMDTFKRV